MRGRRGTIAATVAVALLMAGLVVVPLIPGTSGVHGRLIGSGGPPGAERRGVRDLPWRDQVIVALDAGGQVVTKTLTDTDGHFTLDLEPGTYTIESYGRGWKEAWGVGGQPGSRPRRLTVFPLSFRQTRLFVVLR